MGADPTGRRDRDRVFHGAADRWIGRLLLLFLVTAVPIEMARPSLAGVTFDLGAAAFFAVMGWLCFRMGFRMQLTARHDHFEVANLLTVERIAYRDVASIQLDPLSIRITLDSGKRIRVWALSGSLVGTGGSRGPTLGDRLSAIVAERQTGEGPPRARTHFPDWWVPLALFTLFSSVIIYHMSAV